MCTNGHACDCTRGGVDTRKRAFTEGWPWEKNPLPHWGIEPASAAWQSDALTNWATSPPYTTSGQRWSCLRADSGEICMRCSGVHVGLPCRSWYHTEVNQPDWTTSTTTTKTETTTQIFDLHHCSGTSTCKKKKVCNKASFHGVRKRWRRRWCFVRTPTSWRCHQHVVSLAAQNSPYWGKKVSL